MATPEARARRWCHRRPLALAVACLLGLAITGPGLQQDEAAMAIGLPGVARADHVTLPATVEAAAPGKALLKVRLRGERFGRKARVVVRGTGGSSRGVVKRMSLRRTAVLEDLPSGRYRVRAKPIRRGHKRALAGTQTVRLSPGEGRILTIRYRMAAGTRLPAPAESDLDREPERPESPDSGPGRLQPTVDAGIPTQSEEPQAQLPPASPKPAASPAPEEGPRILTADEVYRRFTHTGSTQSWTVPTGVTQVLVTAVGGGGGGSSFDLGDSGAVGGAGASVTTTQTVTPGQSLSVYVAAGGSGGAAGTSNPTAESGGGYGYGVGGSSPDGGSSYANAGMGGGGGGSSAVIGTGVEIVAGGGGGAGGFSVSGSGAGNTGGDGAAAGTAAGGMGQDDRGGAGGSGGTGGLGGNGATSGSGGPAGAGGNGVPLGASNQAAGGGGGGGYGGGGGGGGSVNNRSGGGGGGSKVSASGASNTTYAAAGESLGYGLGGSAATSTGAAGGDGGDGMVSIAVLGVPSNISTDDSTPGEVTVTWEAASFVGLSGGSVDNIDRYSVGVLASPSATTTGTVCLEDSPVTVGTMQCTVSGLATGTYYVRMRARYNTGQADWGEYSAPVEITVS